MPDHPSHPDAQDASTADDIPLDATVYRVKTRNGHSSDHYHIGPDACHMIRQADADLSALTRREAEETHDLECCSRCLGSTDTDHGDPWALHRELGALPSQQVEKSRGWR